MINTFYLERLKTFTRVISQNMLKHEQKPQQIAVSWKQRRMGLNLFFV